MRNQQYNMFASFMRDRILQIEVQNSDQMDSADAEEEEEPMEMMSKSLPSFWEALDLQPTDMDHPHILPDTLFNHSFNASAQLFISTDTNTVAPFLSSINTTEMASEDGCSPTNSFMEALPWIRITFGLLMMAENSLSLLALWHVRHMQHAVHRFISSLAVAELLMGVWCCYSYSAEILIGSRSANFECRLRFMGLTYLNFAAILSVCALCLDRCVALHVPFRYVELVTKKRVRMALAAIWVLPFFFVLTAYVDTADGAMAYEGGAVAVAGEEDCSFVHIASQRTYVVLTVLRCLLIAVIIVSELLIFRSARCQIIKIYPNVFSSRNSNRFLRMNAKVAITTLAVVVPFLLLYFPVLLVQGNLAARPHIADSCQSQLLSFVWLFASAHGLFTPLIFCWRFTEVRQNLLRLLCCRAPPRPQASVFHVRTTNDSGLTV